MKKNGYIMMPGLCGLAFLVWLSSCARLAYDDYLFAACFKNHSFIEAIKILSNTHTFRWTTFLLQDLVFGMVPGQYFPVSICVFFTLFYVLWVHQLRKLIRTGAKKYLAFEVGSGCSLGLASLLIIAFYFAASQAVETFTFHGAVCDRLVPLLFITIVLNLLLSPNKGWNTFVKLGIMALLIAGTAENVTVSLLIGLLLFMAWRKFVLRGNISAPLIFFSAALVIFVMMELMSPGSDARYQAEKVHRFTCGDDNAYCADTASLFLSRFFQWRQLFVMPILLLFLFAAADLPASAKSTLEILLKKTFALVAGAHVLVVLFHLVAVYLVFGCYGPMRLWFPVNAMLLIMGGGIALYFGSRASGEMRTSRILAGAVVIALVILYFSRHYGATKAYRNAYDQRVSELAKMDSSAAVVEVEALPPADLVVEGDIMQDENDDVNRDFADTYRLPFKVRRK